MSDSKQPEDKLEKIYVGTGFHWGLAAILLLIVLVAVVAAQNTHDVTFEFLWFEWTIPLFVVILVVVVSAVVLIEVAGWLWRRRRRQLLTDRDELRRLRTDAVKPKVPITPVRPVPTDPRPPESRTASEDEDS